MDHDLNLFTRGSFIRMDERLLARRDITHLQKVLVARLVDYCRISRSRICWPSQETLADDLGASERAIRDAIKVLEGKGFIEVLRQETPEGQCRKKPNQYRVLNLPPGSKATRQPKLGEVGGSVVAVVPPPVIRPGFVWEAKPWFTKDVEAKVA